MPLIASALITTVLGGVIVQRKSFVYGKKSFPFVNVVTNEM